MSVKPEDLRKVLDAWERIAPDADGVRRVPISRMTLYYLMAVVEMWGEIGVGLDTRAEEMAGREDA